MQSIDWFKSLSYEERIRIIHDIERGCNNCAIERADKNNILANWSNDLFCDVYNSICYKVAINIDPHGPLQNTSLLEKLKSNELAYSDIAKCSSVELCPEMYKDILERIEASKLVKQTVKTSSMYRCGKCRDNKCQVENIYNRGLDEGVSLRVTCMSCGFQFIQAT